MDTRWIAHYKDGETHTSEWGSEADFQSFEDFCHKPISSMQLQTKEGKLFTLSSNKGQSVTFWQRDTYEEGDVLARSVLKRLSKNVWLELTLRVDSERPEINIIKDRIK